MMESMHVADWIALATLVATFIAVLVAVVALVRGNKNASVATRIALNEAFREAWQRFHRAKDDNERAYQFSELMNLIEIACGVECEKSLTGISRTSMNTYLKDILGLLINNEYARREIPKMLHAPSTFCNIKQFINSKPKLSLTIPPEWYETTN